MLKELSENYKKLSGNHINMKKDIETKNKNQVELRNTISGMKNTLEGIKSMQKEAEAQISELENKVGRKPSQSNITKKKKILKKNEDSLMELWDNINHSNIPNHRDTRRRIKGVSARKPV